jgi:outer membrane murein-binding lipoprotein Lpp
MMGMGGKRLLVLSGVKGLVLTGALFLTGCARLQHLDQLLTLKDLSGEQDSLGRHVEEQDARFDALLRAVEDKTIGQYTDERKILKDFGEPVYREETTRGNQQLNRWAYRYATQFFGSPKVYLYLDPGGRLVRWEFIGGGEHGTIQ